MADDVFQFLWDVRDAGYYWDEVRPAPPDRLSDWEQYEPELFLMEAGGDTVIRRYDPFQKHSGLFREFADTSPTQEGILGFANKYGRLGGQAEKGTLVWVTDSESPTLGPKSESLRAWAGQIQAMREAINLWDLAKAGDTGGLSNLIEWEGRDIVRRRFAHDPDFEGQIIASWGVSPELLQIFRPGDLIQPALVATQRIINWNLESSPKLLWDYKQGRLELRIVPDSLIGAMWLQCARAIDGNKTYRRCAECQTWFAISPETARVTRTYCSNACRSKAYRKRQSEAERLHAEGIPIEDIARRLDSDIKTVAKWVGEKSRAV